MPYYVFVDKLYFSILRDFTARISFCIGLGSVQFKWCVLADVTRGKFLRWVQFHSFFQFKVIKEYLEGLEVVPGTYTGQKQQLGGAPRCRRRRWPPYVPSPWRPCRPLYTGLLLLAFCRKESTIKTNTLSMLHTNWFTRNHLIDGIIP